MLILVLFNNALQPSGIFRVFYLDATSRALCELAIILVFTLSIAGKNRPLFAGYPGL